MVLLVGKKVKNGCISKVIEVPYNNRKEFFIALVTISDKVGIDVPLWTSKEDRLLENGEVIDVIVDGKTNINIYRKIV